MTGINAVLKYFVLKGSIIATNLWHAKFIKTVEPAISLLDRFFHTWFTPIVDSHTLKITKSRND